MTIFTIDSENNIATHGSASEITDKGSEQFTSEKELARAARVNKESGAKFD